MENLDNYANVAMDLITTYGPKLVGAIVVLIVGLWVIGVLTKMVNRAMERSSLDASLRPFFKSLTGTLLKVLLVISVLGMLGIEMTSFIAILSRFLTRFSRLLTIKPSLSPTGGFPPAR